MYKRYLKFLLAYIFDQAFGELGLTEDQLAGKAGLHPSTIYKLRTGWTKDPKHQTIWKLLRAAKIDAKVVAEEMAELA